MADKTPAVPARGFSLRHFLALDLAVGSTFAYFSIPSLTGALGIAKAVGIGVGMTMGSVLAVPAALFVGMIGFVLGTQADDDKAPTHKSKTGLQGFNVGAVIGMAAGVLGGNAIGYTYVKDMMVKDNARTEFNIKAAPSPVKATTLVIPAQNFQKCRMI